LAVGNAKSHPISAGGRHETAISFLTDLQEKLDVAQVQLEIYNTLLPHVNDGEEIGQKIKLLASRLFTMTDVRSFVCICTLLSLNDFTILSCTNCMQIHSTFQR
jgi:hypothetical protein